MKAPEYLINILALRHKYFTIFLPHLHAYKVVHKTHVFHFKLSCKVLLARLYQLIITYQNMIIEIKNNDQWFTFYHDVIKVRFCFTLGEAQLGEIAIDPGLPSTWCLLQPIQSPLESAHMRLMIEGLEIF